MDICSTSFLLFVGATLVLYTLIPKKLIRLQSWVLLTASIGFYLSFGIQALAYVLATAVLTYVAALLTERFPTGSRLWVSLQLTVSFGLLLLLKYRGFLNYSVFRGGLDFLSQNLFIARHLVLPLGISFYTLSAVGYTLDVARTKIPAEKDPFRFLLFILYFPHILQGPIARYDRLAPQLSSPHAFHWNVFVRGLERMLWGYFKKLVIANRAAILVDAVYTHAAVRGGTELLIASLCYTLQIYCDFSGCVDILGGVSELFGISLDANFAQPYLSRSLNDFWRRWHISLSTWFRDYIYIPLGGSRKGEARRWANLLLVFLISGFWHGAGWNYIFWGAFHGIYQVLEHLFYRYLIKKKPESVSSRYAWLQRFTTFLAVNFAWVFFRISSLRTGLKILRAIVLRPSLHILGSELFSFGLDAPEIFILLLSTALLLAVDVYNSRGGSVRDALTAHSPVVRWLVLSAGLAAVLVFGIYGLEFNAGSFIYMQF